METSIITPEENYKDDELIFALAPFPMWIFDLESLKFLAVNKEAVRQYGYSKTEFLSMTIKKIRPVQDISKLEKAIQEVRNRTNLYKESLYRHQKKDGTVINVQIKSNLINYKGRRAEIVTAIDLTKRLQEQKQVEKQKQYLETIERINDALIKCEDWIAALDNCFKYIGETLKIDRIYFFQNDLKKKTTSQRLKWAKKTKESQPDNPKLQEIPFSKFPVFMEPLLKGKNFEAVVSELPSSPTKKYLQEQEIKTILVAPVMSHNSFIGFIGIDDCSIERKWEVEESQIIKSLTTNLANIIERNIFQTELINNEYKFRTIVQKGSDLMAILDEEGNFQYVNHSSIEVLGTSPKEFIGKSIDKFIHPEDLFKVEECLKEVLEKDVVSIPPFRFPDATGSYRWVETKLTNLLNDPVISGIVANTWDVTLEVERKIERDLLEVISKAIGQPSSLKASLGQALKELLNLPGICLGEVWLKSQDNSQLNLRAFRYKSAEFKSFYTTPLPASLSFGKGLPGYLWENKKTVLWSKIADCENFLRKDAAKILGLQTAIGIPINYNDEFLGSFVLFSKQDKSRLADVEKLLKEIGSKLGAVVKQKITEDEYRSFFEISPDPHCIIGFDGYLKKFNRSFNELLDYEESTLINEQIFSFIHEDDKAKALKSIKSSFAHNTSKSLTVRFKTKHRQTKWLIWSFTVIPEAKILLAVAKDITDQKVAEQELKKTYYRLRKAQKIAKLGYWTKDFDSEDSEWSEETYKIFGYNPENFIPTMENVTMSYHPDDRHLIQQDPSKILLPNQVKSFEHRIIKPSGEVRWVRQEIHMIMDEKGQPVSLEGTVQDITDQKNSEQSLKETYNRLRRAQKIANLGYWTRKIDSNISEWSEETYKIFGYTPENFTPTMDNLALTFHPDDRYLTKENPVEGLNPGEVRSFEHRIIKASGEVCWVHQEVHLVTDEKGQPEYIEGTIQDITKRKENEEQIKNSNERFRLAMKASNELIWEIDHATNIINRGSGYEEIIIYNLSEPYKAQNSWTSKIVPEDFKRVWNSFQRALKDPEITHWKEEYRIFLEEGEIKYFIDRCLIHRDEKGNPIRTVGSVLDVTLSRRQLEQIKLQNKNLKEIAWLQSHVVRAPLAKIMGLIELTKDYKGRGLSFEEMFDLISTAALELDKVVHEIANKTEIIKQDGITNSAD